MVTTETADAETIMVEIAAEVLEETTTAEDLEETTEALEAEAKEEVNLLAEEVTTEILHQADAHLEDLILQLQEREDLEEAKNYFI